MYGNERPLLNYASWTGPAASRQIFMHGNQLDDHRLHYRLGSMQRKLLVRHSDVKTALVIMAAVSPRLLWFQELDDGCGLHQACPRLPRSPLKGLCSIVGMLMRRKERWRGTSWILRTERRQLILRTDTRR